MVPVYTMNMFIIMPILLDLEIMHLRYCKRRGLVYVVSLEAGDWCSVWKGVPE